MVHSLGCVTLRFATRKRASRTTYTFLYHMTVLKYFRKKIMHCFLKIGKWIRLKREKHSSYVTYKTKRQRLNQLKCVYVFQMFQLCICSTRNYFCFLTFALSFILVLPLMTLLILKQSQGAQTFVIFIGLHLLTTQQSLLQNEYYMPFSCILAIP